MDIPLRNALDALRRAKSRGLPSAETVERSQDGSKWYGKTENGDRWMLVKHKAGSYNAGF